MKSVIIKGCIALFLFIALVKLSLKYREHRDFARAPMLHSCSYQTKMTECKHWLKKVFFHPVDSIKVREGHYLVLTLQYGFQKKKKNDYGSLIYLTNENKKLSYKFILSTLDFKALNPSALNKIDEFTYVIEGQKNRYKVLVSEENLKLERIEIIKRDRDLAYSYEKKDIIDVLKVRGDQKVDPSLY